MKVKCTKYNLGCDKSYCTVARSGGCDEDYGRPFTDFDYGGQYYITEITSDHICFTCRDREIKVTFYNADSFEWVMKDIIKEEG